MRMVWPGGGVCQCHPSGLAGVHRGRDGCWLAAVVSEPAALCLVLRDVFGCRAVLPGQGYPLFAMVATCLDLRARKGRGS